MTDHDRNLKPSRRAVLAGGTAAALALPAVWTGARAQTKRLIVRTPGGPTAEAMKKAYYEPFQAATGIEIVAATSNNEPVSQIKAIVESKAKTWDMAASLSRSAVNQLVKDGDFLEKHGLENEAVVKEIPETFRNAHAVGHGVYATPLTYRKDKFKEPPQNWQDFFDVKKFPGPRAMRKNPQETLEIALMADGVDRKSLYPLDLDRAFKSLDRIKPHVAHWWTSPVQAIQLITNGDVEMVPVWANFPIAAVEQQSAPLGIAWQNNIWGCDMFTILKGGDNADACRKFILFCLQGEQQAGVGNRVAIAPTNPNAFKFISPERAKVLATNPEYLATGIGLNDEFWAANRDAIADRFNKWLLS